MPNLRTILTNEVKLHDYRGTSFSLSFGDSDVNEGQSYSSLKFLADTNKVDIIIDRPIFNITSDFLKIKDKDVWSELKQGPNTGMNADMVDGFHYYDFKDALGTNYFKHMFSNGSLTRYVKIASFMPRRVGRPGAYPEDGNMAYQNLFTKIETEDRIEEFVVNTPISLSSAGVFQSTGLTREGIFNSCSRGTISILGDNPSTLDFHIGLFYDPESNVTSGINATRKLFYISSHSENIPKLSNSMLRDFNEKVDILNEMNSRVVGNQESPFEPLTPLPNSYGDDVNTLRLYYIGSEIEEVDGNQVVVHKYDLYMAIEESAEYHVAPAMSSSAVFYNYSTPVSESELPKSAFINPESIYDKRYAHTDHRHSDIEELLMTIMSQIDGAWNDLDYFVLKNQGLNNANKILLTDSTGEVYAAENNTITETSISKLGSRVITSNASRKLVESNITTTELNHLDNSKSNIQAQIDAIKTSLSNLTNTVNNLNVPSVSGFVRKVGDEMSGDLTLKNQSRLYLNDDEQGEAYIYAHSTNYLLGITSQGTSIIRYPKEADCVQFSKTSMLLDDTKFTINPTAPSSPSNGDVWIKNS